MYEAIEPIIEWTRYTLNNIKMRIENKVEKMKRPQFNAKIIKELR